jgi:hypothetical protein
LAADFVDEHGGKDALSEKMETNDNLLVMWMNKVAEHEAKRSEGGYSKTAETQVKAEDSTSLTARRLLGYFWSPALYKIHHNGRSPRDDNLKMQTIHGRRGVLLDETHGKPLGVEDVGMCCAPVGVRMYRCG